MVVTAGFQNSHVHFTEAKWTDAAHQPAATLTDELSVPTIARTGNEMAATAARHWRTRELNHNGARNGHAERGLQTHTSPGSSKKRGC